MAQTFNADECRAFCHPEEYVQMPAVDLIDLWTHLWAIGYCGALLGQFENPSPEVVQGEREMLKDFIEKTGDILKRHIDELPNWVETMHREYTKRDVRERWAREDAEAHANGR